MLEFLYFCLLCVLFTLIFLPVHSNKKISPNIKMAEELISNLGYESPQSDTKRQKLLECILTSNSKLYLGKAYTEEQLKNLAKKKWKNVLIITKLSYQARW